MYNRSGGLFDKIGGIFKKAFSLPGKLIGGALQTAGQIGGGLIKNLGITSIGPISFAQSGQPPGGIPGFPGSVLPTSETKSKLPITPLLIGGGILIAIILLMKK